MQVIQMSLVISDSSCIAISTTITSFTVRLQGLSSFSKRPEFILDEVKANGALKVDIEE